MRLHLVLVVVVSAVSAFTPITPDGVLSPENLAKFQKTKPGVDLRKRAERLRALKGNLQSTSGISINSILGGQHKAAVKLERPTENDVDMVELNGKLGISEYMFEGDIDVTEEQLQHLENQRTKRQASSVFQKWPNGIVYYTFDATLSERKKTTVLQAIDYLMSHTCLTFIQNAAAVQRINIFSGAGCYSTIGMQNSVQQLSLGDGCETVGTVAHEFMHALGVWHMQSRFDRDNHVTIDSSVIDASKLYNYNKVAEAETVMYTPYEYGSVMHYGANAFANSRTDIAMQPKDDDYTYTMGSRQISFYDYKLINDHYGCTAKCPAATSANCQNGGVPNPRNCQICNCPSGFGGDLCDERPSGCGAELTATTEWQTETITVGDASSGTSTSRDDAAVCNHWVKAPAGGKVQVKITSMYNSQCNFGCPFNGVELKVLADTKPTNPLVCCTELFNVEHTSELNPTPVVSYNRYYYSTVKLQYRYIPNAETVAPTTVAPTTVAPTTVAPTTVAPTTVAPTTVAPTQSSFCVDRLSATECASKKAAGFCVGSTSFGEKKYTCAVTCGLCGQKADACQDFNPQCGIIKTYGLCTKWDPIRAEFNCASTCGFCDKPV